MASIRKRNDLWQVQVRCRHAGSASKSFHRKTDAERWATAQEALMQSGQWKDKTTNSIVLTTYGAHCHCCLPVAPLLGELGAGRSASPRLVLQRVSRL